MERVAESGLFSFFGGQSLDWFEVEIVIKMQVSQVLPMDKKVEHVETLPADLKASFNPIDSGLLEKFCLPLKHLRRER